MEMLCQFGPVKVLFQDLPTAPLWPFWRWKLDPFRVAGGKPDITVGYTDLPVEPTGKPIWEHAGTQVCRRVHRLADGSFLWQQTEQPTGTLQLQLIVSSNWKEITLTRDRSPTAGMGAFEALTFLIFYAFAHRQVLTLHGALVEADGKGFLICAASGVGKTTHARLWRDHKNALILNGDRATCFRQEGTWFGFGTPWCGTSGEYLNRSVPLQAVVVLQRGEENRVVPAPGMSLLSHGVYPSWDRATTEASLSLLDCFLEEIPVLRLECRPNAEAVEILHKALERLPL